MKLWFKTAFKYIEHKNEGEGKRNDYNPYNRKALLLYNGPWQNEKNAFFIVPYNWKIDWTAQIFCIHTLTFKHIKQFVTIWMPFTFLTLIDITFRRTPNFISTIDLPSNASVKSLFLLYFILFLRTKIRRKIEEKGTWNRTETHIKMCKNVWYPFFVGLLGI